MKKIFNILFSAVICLAGIAACTPDYPVGKMAGTVTVNTANKDVAAAGQSFDVNVTADGAWAVSAPEWITVKPASGYGDETVTITVKPNAEAERTGKVGFYSAVGRVTSTSTTLESTPLAEVTVTQEADASQGGGGADGNAISIADYLKLGENNDTYVITGTITRVVNTKYGNFDLTDETGTIYVYGLLNEKLEDQKCFAEKDLAMGDVLTIQAPSLQLYKDTWEIVNAVYVSHTKSLIKLDGDSVDLPIEGANFDIKANVKGADVKADYDADWITFTGADKDGEDVTLHFSAAANTNKPRKATIAVSTTTAKGESSMAEFTVNQDGITPTATVADLLAEGASTEPYKITGVITRVANTKYGNFDLTDATGTIYVYGLLNEEKEQAKCWADKGLALGDVITVLTDSRTVYNNALQIANAIYESHYTPMKLESDAKVALPKEGGDFTVVVTMSNVEELNVTVPDWITYVGDSKDGDKVTYTFKAAANTGDARKGDIEITGTTASLPLKVVVSAEQEGAPVPASNDVTVTTAGLPTAYPEAEATFTEGGIEYNLLKVANYGNGIQMQGKKNSYISNKTAMPADIKTITVTTFEGKAYYQGNLKVYAGNAENPAGTALVGTLSDDKNSETFAVPAGCKFFKVVNESNYAVYLDNIKIELEGAAASNDVTVTTAGLPTAYPEAEATFSEGGFDFNLLKVANYGNGIQMQGKKNSYISNATAMPADIKSITVTTFEGKAYYQGNLKVYAGNAENPAGTALTGTLSDDKNSETFEVPAGCKFFKVVNESNYAVYLDNIKIAM